MKLVFVTIDRISLFDEVHRSLLIQLSGPKKSVEDQMMKRIFQNKL